VGVDRSEARMYRGSLFVSGAQGTIKRIPSSAPRHRPVVEEREVLNWKHKWGSSQTFLRVPASEQYVMRSSSSEVSIK
jgi:hypothetical protein